MRCPNCKSMLVYRRGDEIHIRADGKLLLKADGCHCQCHFCKAEIIIPLEMQKGIEVPEQRFYLGAPTVEHRKDLTKSGKPGTFQKDK